MKSDPNPNHVRPCPDLSLGMRQKGLSDSLATETRQYVQVNDLGNSGIAEPWILRFPEHRDVPSDGVVPFGHIHPAPSLLLFAEIEPELSRRLVPTDRGERSGQDLGVRDAQGAQG